MSQFKLSDENPNDIVGGAGCLCHPRGSDETRGPFLVFASTTTDDNLSPHIVLCAHCACVASDKVHGPAEPEEVIELEAEEWPVENPTFTGAEGEIPVVKI